MSYRFDTPLIVDGYHLGNRGLGVLGSEVASSGINGPGYIYNDLSLPTDANKEYSGFVVTPPGVGTFFVYEDSSFSYVGPSTSFVYRLKEDGVDKGTQTVTINMTTDAAGIVGWTESNDTSAITVNVAGFVSTGISWVEVSDTTSIVASVNVIPAATIAYIESNDVSSIISSVFTPAISVINWTETSDLSLITVHNDLVVYTPSIIRTTIIRRER